MAQARLLCLPGGGARGMIQAVSTSYFSDDFIDNFNAVICTSTGMWTGLGTAKYNGQQIHTANEAVQLFSDCSPVIFSNPWQYKLKSALSLLTCKYNGEGLNSIINHVFPENLRLSDLDQTIWVVTQNVKTGEPFIFNSQEARENRERNYYQPGTCDDFYIRDVARSAVGAPYYFGSHVVTGIYSGQKYNLCDAGLFANDPCAIGVDEFYRTYHSSHKLHVTSIGTGYWYDIDPEKVKNAGALYLLQKSRGIEWAFAVQKFAAQKSLENRPNVTSTLLDIDFNPRPGESVTPIFSIDYSTPENMNALHRYGQLMFEEALNSGKAQEIMDVLAAPKPNDFTLRQPAENFIRYTREMKSYANLITTGPNETFSAFGGNVVEFLMATNPNSTYPENSVTYANGSGASASVRPLPQSDEYVHE